MGPWPVYVGFTADPAALARELSLLGLDPIEDFTTGSATTRCQVYKGVPLILITMKRIRGRPREQVAATVAHEAAHAMQYLRERLSPHEPLGAEAEAYIVGHITAVCLADYWATGLIRAWQPTP